MAHIKVYNTIQSCPNCGKRLLKVTAGTTLIGSPLISCKKCKTTCRTQLRVEWYQYQPKWMVFGMPLIISGLMLLVGAIMGDQAVGVFAAILCFLVCLCFTARDVVRIIQSKKRMRDPAYLQRLLQAQLISWEEYREFSDKLN